MIVWTTRRLYALSHHSLKKKPTKQSKNEVKANGRKAFRRAATVWQSQLKIQSSQLSAQKCMPNSFVVFFFCHMNFLKCCQFGNRMHRTNEKLPNRMDFVRFSHLSRCITNGKIHFSFFFSSSSFRVLSILNIWTVEWTPANGLPSHRSDRWCDSHWTKSRANYQNLIVVVYIKDQTTRRLWLCRPAEIATSTANQNFHSFMLNMMRRRK